MNHSLTDIELIDDYIGTVKCSNSLIYVLFHIWTVNDKFVLNEHDWTYSQLRISIL